MPFIDPTKTAGSKLNPKTNNIPSVTPQVLIPGVQQIQPDYSAGGSGTGGDGTGGGTGGGTGYVAPAFDESMVDSDTSFALQKAALDAALQKAISDIGTQRDRYNIDYGNSLRKLGFSGNSGVLDTAKFDPTSGKWSDAAGATIAAPGNWNETDVTTASGRGFHNALNDFAARGMLQSTAYNRARNNLERNLNEQLSSAAQARQQALADWSKGETEAANTNKAGIAQSRAEAAARIKASLGLA